MALSAFDDKAHRPSVDDLKRTLGRSAPLWEQLIAEASEAHAPIRQEWNFAGAKYGWSLKLKRRERVVLYMTPQPGEFQLGVVIGEKAAAAAGSASQRVRDLIEHAPRYAEGRGIRFPVRTKADVVAARQLAALKMGT